MMGTFERQYFAGEPLTITGKGTQRRDFIHVYDIVSGLMLIGQEEWHRTTFNLGTGKNYSVNEVAAMFGCETTYISAWPGEAKITKADNRFTKRMLHWEPQVSLSDYVVQLKETKKWHKW